MRYTASQNQAACRAASAVYSGKMTPDEAVEQLRAEHNINETSAQDFIRIYKSLAEGRTFLRGMSAGAMDLFLSDILQVHRQSGISHAVASLQQHIDRTEKSSGSRMHSTRKVLEKYQTHAEPMQFAESISESLEAAVLDSFNLPSETRRNRLASANPSPRVSMAKVRVFHRNPDVVAEVLIRANGICEACHCPAPFRRAKDDTPYLEVHHRKTLASGGKDTVENAIALCPNCHREAHYAKR